MPQVRWRGLLLLLLPLLLWLLHSSKTDLQLLNFLQPGLQRPRSKLAPGTNKEYGAGQEDGSRLNMTVSTGQ